MAKKGISTTKTAKKNTKKTTKKNNKLLQREKRMRKLVKKYGLEAYDESMQKQIITQYLRRERMRKLVILACLILAIGGLGYFISYNYYTERTGADVEQLAELKGRHGHKNLGTVNKTSEDTGTPDVLEEYVDLYNKNKSLIGWIKIEGTVIDYPVMQSASADYYLDHNFNQEYDRNGSIFMDPACDVLKPSTNLILYGHHMKSGNMFGNLSLYQDKSYRDEHRRIQFDTIYEKGTYEVMYAFPAKLYNDDEVVFKYYQFIDAFSAEEFDSNMREMANMSLYDTGVHASFGDQLLTLSTCDGKQQEGRFVVVAKRIR